MSIVDRISTLVRANINDLLDRAEDPEKVIKQLLVDMNSQLLQVKTQVAASIADEKQLEQRYQENEAKAEDWHHKAGLAVNKGEDDLAREALVRYNAFQQTADGFKEQYQEQAQQVEVLKQALHQLEQKIQEADTKKDLLIARSRRAKAETQIRTTLSGMDAGGALSNFGRLEEKVNQQEARAGALAELDTDSTEQRFHMLETESQIEGQLAALKAKQVGALGPGEEERPALGAGKTATPELGSGSGSGSES